MGDNWTRFQWTVGGERDRRWDFYRFICGQQAVGALGSCRGHSIGGRYLRKTFLEPSRGGKT